MPADISTLIADLSADDLPRRIAAAEQLSQRSDAGAAAIPLVRATGDPNPQVREFANSALEDMGPPATAEVPALAELLGDSSPDVAYWAATLLGRTGEQAAEAVSALAHALTEAEASQVKQRAAWALGQIGSSASEAKPALQQAAESEDRRLARLASSALSKL